MFLISTESSKHLSMFPEQTVYWQRGLKENQKILAKPATTITTKRQAIRVKLSINNIQMQGFGKEYDQTKYSGCQNSPNSRGAPSYQLERLKNQLFQRLQPASKHVDFGQENLDSS